MLYFAYILVTVALIIRVSYETPPPTRTAGGCRRQMKTAHYEKGLRYNEDGDNRTASLLTGDFTNAEINEFCIIENKGIECLNGVPDSDNYKTTTLNRRKSFPFLCNESSIKEKAGCWNNVSKTTENECNQMNKCGGHKQKYMEALQLSVLQTGENRNQYIRETCNYVNCSNNCRKAAIINQCGQELQNDINVFVQKTVKFMWLYNREGDAPTYIRECEELAGNRMITESV